MHFFHALRGSQWHSNSILSMPAYVIIIVEVYTGDHFVINLGFWKTSEQEEHVMVEIKQIYHLKPKKKWISSVYAVFPVYTLFSGCDTNICM